MKASLRPVKLQTQENNAAAYGTGLPPVARPPRSGRLKEAALGYLRQLDSHKRRFLFSPAQLRAAAQADAALTSAALCPS